MNKFFRNTLALAAAGVLSVGSAFAAVPELDFKSLQTAEIYTIMQAARNELAARNDEEAKGLPVFYDQDGIKVYLKSVDGVRKYVSLDKRDMVAVDVTMIIVNGSEQNITVSTDDAYIEGWQASSFVYSQVEAGKKSKETFYLYIEADMVSDTISDFSLTVKAIDQSTYKTIFKTSADVLMP